jgi:ribonuclease R
VAKKSKQHFPTAKELLEYIKKSPTRLSRREIARAFKIHGKSLHKLNTLLEEIGEAGLVAKRRKKKSQPRLHLPPILGVTVSSELSEEGHVLLIPIDRPNAKVPILLIETGISRVKAGDRLLVRLTWNRDHYYTAHILKKMQEKSSTLVGVVIKTGKQLYLQPCDRKRQGDLCPIKENFAEGLLVLAEIQEKRGSKYANVLETIGSVDDPQTISLISIFQEKIPYEFPDEVLKEAEKVRTLSLEGREDLRSIPFVTIDGEDARDFDDAVWAEEDPEQGWHLMVAIADVAYYVKPNSELDREAYLRGNSVYFPDRVVPMLPEVLSNELCSLRPHEDKACFAVHLWLDKKGRLKNFKFVRGIMRSLERLTYTQVQKAIDGMPDEKTAPLLNSVIKPLYEAYALLQKAREFRGTLDLELPERQVIWDKAGHIEDIHPRPRLDSHRLIEEFMILANVAAAQQLEALQAPCLYRVHDEPNPEKIFIFRELIEGLGFSFPKSQAITPRAFRHLLRAAHGSPHQALISQLTLRAQAQAIYHPQNIGHFGLNLKKYSHFTSPIRRYADLVVHRSLIAALNLGDDGLTEDANMEIIGEQVSTTERRASSAEKAALERYISLYLKDKIGKIFEGRINGVFPFGFFVTLEPSGAEGFVPMHSLDDYYYYEEHRHRLRGRRTRRTLTLGDTIQVILREVDTLTGALLLGLEKGTPPAPKKKMTAKKSISKPKSSKRLLE